MTIRPEKENEFAKIYDLIKTAFQTAKVSNGKEQDFANELRAGKGYIPELALVAEEDGEVIGHIMLTEWPVSDGDIKHVVLLIAPVCVALAKRNNGFASKLINESLARAKAKGYEAVMLVGDPAFYGRLASSRPPRSGYGIPTAFPMTM